MLLPFIAITAGLGVLIWSADRFVEGSASVAFHSGIPPLIIGMVIIGFGTSVPEMVVSALASFQGNPGIAIGNAYGSNIANIALILGLTAIINPIAVNSRILRNELPVLFAVTLLAAFQVFDGKISFVDAIILLGVFSSLGCLAIRLSLKEKQDSLAIEVNKEISAHQILIGKAIFLLIVGLVFLILSSRSLVWGSVEIARVFGISDTIIGLTIVALGTSLPELASSVTAARKGENDIALGNILGSNLFNTLAVVGIAGIIHPFSVPPEIFNRDIMLMGFLTLSLFVIGHGLKGKRGKINRYEGSFLLTVYICYNVFLIFKVIKG